MSVHTHITHLHKGHTYGGRGALALYSWSATISDHGFLRTQVAISDTKFSRLDSCRYHFFLLLLQIALCSHYPAWLVALQGSISQVQTNSSAIVTQSPGWGSSPRVAAVCVGLCLEVVHAAFCFSLLADWWLSCSLDLLTKGRPVKDWMGVEASWWGLAGVMKMSANREGVSLRSSGLLFLLCSWLKPQPD